MVAAGSLVTPNTTVPTGEIWAGNPAKKLRELDAEEAEFILQSAVNYSALARIHAAENAKTHEEVTVSHPSGRDMPQNADVLAAPYMPVLDQHRAVPAKSTLYCLNAFSHGSNTACLFAYAYIQKCTSMQHNSGPEFRVLAGCIGCIHDELRHMLEPGSLPSHTANDTEMLQHASNKDFALQIDKEAREDRLQRDPDYDSHLGIERDPITREITHVAEST